MSMKNLERYQTKDTVVARDLGDEVVLLDLEGGTYFGLNEVGALIWSGIEANKSVDEIAISIAEEFEADPKQVEGDVSDLLAGLLEKGLIVCETTTASHRDV